MPPLTVGERKYRRVLCDGERVYYALTPFASDMLGLQAKELADALRTTSGYPDFVYMRESVFPHDVARLRELHLMNDATRNRAFITADAIFRVYKKPWTPFIEQQMAALRAALEADEALQNRDADPSAGGMKRGREEEDMVDDAEMKDVDLDEEIAVQPHHVLQDIAVLQQNITHFRNTLSSLESEYLSLKKAVEAKIAASASSGTADSSQPAQQPPPAPAPAATGAAQTTEQQQPEQAPQQPPVQWQ